MKKNPPPFNTQFLKCKKEGLTEKTRFFPFEKFPEFLPAFPSPHMVKLVKSEEWNGNDFIICGKFGGICSSGNTAQNRDTMSRFVS